MRGGLVINVIFGINWIYYGPKEILCTIGEYSYFGLLSSFVLSMDEVL